MTLREKIAYWLLHNGFIHCNDLILTVFYRQIFAIVTTIIFCMNIFEFYPCKLWIAGEYSLIGSTLFSLMFAGVIAYLASVATGGFLASFCKKEIKQAYKKHPDKVIWPNKTGKAIKNI